MKHTNLPGHIYVWVNNKYLGPKMPKGYTYGLWHGIHSREGQILMAHVLLETGAQLVWMYLFTQCLTFTDQQSGKRSRPSCFYMPWTAMGPHIEAWDAKYLDGLKVECFRQGYTGIHTGIIIDWSGRRL